MKFEKLYDALTAGAGVLVEKYIDEDDSSCIEYANTIYAITDKMEVIIDFKNKIKYGKKYKSHKYFKKEIANII